MNIIVTGADGFIGSHLTEMLVAQGYQVKALSQYNSFNNWGWLEDSPYKNDFEVVLGDIRDYDSVNNVMKNCDTVFHFVISDFFNDVNPANPYFSTANDPITFP